MAILTPETIAWGPQHLLLIGNTKAGKTHYAVEAIKDGYEVIYIDSDNGLATIRSSFGTNAEYYSRLHYFGVGNMEVFLVGFLTETTFQWNETRRIPFSRANSAPEDRICEIKPGRIPPRILLIIDSWTSFTLSCLRNKAKQLQVDLTEIDKYGRDIYGGAGFQATQVAGILQNLRFGVIVIAHSTSYERKEKPTGTVGQITEKEMIIKETIQVPISTSAPHGLTLGKFFGQIGNMYLTPRTNRRVIDYKTTYDRIGGGSPNEVLDVDGAGRFSKTFGLPPAPDPLENWIRYVSAAEIIAEQDANKAKPTTPQPKIINSPSSPAPQTVGVKSSIKL